MMTEGEAKEKFCPFARHYAETRTPDAVAGAAGGIIGAQKPFAMAAAAINRLDGIEGNYARCMGSRCMSWRWSTTSSVAPNATGYCGLAGTP